MVRVTGVRFRSAGKIYYFDPQKLEIRKGDHVIVETARGMEYGTVVMNIREVEDDKVVSPLKPILRMATKRDEEIVARNREREKEAFRICQEKIKKHRLEMKLVDAEYTFDNNKVLFYFTADGRVDFRELVKDLASVFKMRIELRQIGVRDETKIRGGVGICGRSLCCHSYMPEFIPVSIKMAKEQNLSLNPTKISGACGRLMCCLKNEQETYEYLNSRLPGIGDTVTTADGLRGEVASVNVLRQLVKVVIDAGDDGEVEAVAAERRKTKRPARGKNAAAAPAGRRKTKRLCGRGEYGTERKRASGRAAARRLPDPAEHGTILLWHGRRPAVGVCGGAAGQPGNRPRRRHGDCADSSGGQNQGFRDHRTGNPGGDGRYGAPQRSAQRPGRENRDCNRRYQGSLEAFRRGFF